MPRNMVPCQHPGLCGGTKTHVAGSQKAKDCAAGVGMFARGTKPKSGAAPTPMPSVTSHSNFKASLDNINEVQTRDRVERELFDTEMGEHFSSSSLVIEPGGERFSLRVTIPLGIRDKFYKAGEVVTFGAHSLHPVPNRIRTREELDLDETYGIEHKSNGRSYVDLDIVDESTVQDFARSHGYIHATREGTSRNGHPTYRFVGDFEEMYSLVKAYDAGE